MNLTHLKLALAGGLVVVITAAARGQGTDWAIDQGNAAVIRASLVDDGATASLSDELAASRVRDASHVEHLGPAVQVDESCCSAKQPLAKGNWGCDQVGYGKNCSCPSCFWSSLRSRGFGSLEYLHWYSKGRSYPPLVTTDLATVPAADAGEFNNGTSTVLFGNDDLGGDLQGGGRLTLGLWLDDWQERALTFRFFANQGESESFNMAAAGNPILAVPFFDTNPLVNAEAAFLASYPGVSEGSITSTATTDVFGGDIFARTMLDHDFNYRLDLMAGYQFNRIDDEFRQTSIATSVGAGATTVTLNDAFDAHNEFHAGSVGLIGEIYHGCWTLSMLGKIAIGNMNQQVTVDGNFTTVGAGPPGAGQGGLFAQPTNIGVFERDVTVYSPEANINLSYAVSDRFSVTVGYTFIYWTRVALAGDLIDRNVNSTQLTGGGLAGPADPMLNFTDTDYWVQAISIGGNLNY